MAENNKQLIRQSARQQALTSVQHFEAEARLACAPEREITPIITSLHSMSMQRYCFTPDGRRVAIGNRRRIYILDLQTRKIVQAFDADEWVEGILVSPDGRAVITCGSDNAVRFRDIYTGKCIRTLAHHDRRVLNLALSPDGRWLASGDCYALCVWDLTTGTCRHWPEDLSQRSIKDFEFSADSKTLYIGVEKSIQLLDVEKGKILREIPRNLEIHELAVTPDERTLITKEGSHFSLYLIDLDTEEERRLEKCSSTWSLSLSPDGQTLATGHETKIQLWDMRDETCQAVIEELPPSFSPIVFNRDGSQLIAHGRGLQLHSLQSHRTVNLIAREPSRLRCSVFASNGRVLVTEGPGSKLNVWDLRTGKLQTQLIGNTDDSDIVYPSGREFVFSPNGKLLVTLANDLAVRVWDMERGRCMQVFAIEERPRPSLLVFHPNKDIIAHTDGEKVIIRDLRANKALSLQEAEFNRLYSITFSQDGRCLVTVDDKTLRQWDILTGECLRTIEFQDYYQVSKDGFLSYHRLVDPDKLTFILGEYVTGGNPPKRLWDPNTGQCLLTFDGFDGMYAKVLPDGKTFLSCDLENNITEWSLETGKCLRKFEGVPAFHDFNRVVDLVLHPDWPVLTAVTREGVFYFWSYSSGSLLATAYNLDRGYLWITPPDEVAKNGWLHTDRPDLISLLEADKGNGEKPEFLLEGDERFEDYLRIYNDSEMVMTRLNDWDRYEQLKQVWLGSKTAMDDHLLAQGSPVQCFLLQSSWDEGPEDETGAE